RRDPRLAHDIELVTAFDPDLPHVRLDADKMRQVIWNLLLNATQALPQGGRIALHARSERDAGRDGVCIEVRDTGPGIPPEQQEKLFQPFLTNRAQGTGLGLAIVQKIVEAHHGRIEVESSQDRGTTFHLYLPVVAS
ncbi:histidine kinase, partial [bacterium]|nr:histidine kinase [bacterium]